MRLFLDEDLRSHELTDRLLANGHHVETLPTGADDERDIWPYAQESKLSVLTRNPADFRALASTTPEHCGLLLVHTERDHRKNMTSHEIVAAIGYVQDVYGEGLPKGTVVNLNEWRRAQSK